MKRIKIAMIGYGNVGQAFAQMLKRKADYFKDNYDAQMDIVAICTRSIGLITDDNGINVDTVDLTSGDKTKDSMYAIENLDYDVMVELTPVNIMTGQPATDHIKAALSRSKHVITANKGPIAWNYRSLRDLAAAKGVCFQYEATIIDGVPTYNFVKHTLKACKIIGVRGIFNATTNFILNELEKGTSWDDAIAKGRKQGFVEADPTMDTDGWDATAKLTALMNVLMDAEITPMEIDRVGIAGVTAEDIQKAKAENKRIKLICEGHLEDGKPVGTVKPTLVPMDDMYATLTGTTSVVTVNTDIMGEVSIVEHEFQPEIDHTAYGVLSDMIAIMDSMQ